MSEKEKNIQPEKKQQVKKKKAPNRFVTWIKSVGKKIKEMFSEVKKVTWPKFPKVIQQTGVVLGVILVFLILVSAIDFGFQALIRLVTGV